MTATVQDWIERGAIPLTEGDFSQNGEYHAREKGYYGYASVDADVSIDSVVGRDPDTGEDTVVRKDDGDGVSEGDDGGGDGGGGGGGGGGESKLVKQVLPSAIQVTELPTKRSYLVGEYLDYTGTEAMALLNSGAIWGMIPYKELIFPQVRVEGDYIPEFVTGSDVSGLRVHTLGNAEAYVEAALGMLQGEILDPYGHLGHGIQNFMDEARAHGLSDKNRIVTVGVVDIGNFKMKEPSNVEIKLIELLISDDPVEIGEIINRDWIYHYWITLNALFYNDPYIAPGQVLIGGRVGGSCDLIQHNSQKYRVWQGTDSETYTDENIISYTMDYVSNLNAYFYNAGGGDDNIPLYYASSELDCGTAMPIEFSTRGKAVAESVNGRHVEYWFDGARLALAYSGRKVYYLAAGVDPEATVLRITERVIDEETGQTVSERRLPSPTFSQQVASQIAIGLGMGNGQAFYCAGMIETTEDIEEVIPHSTDNVAPFIAHIEQTENGVAYANGLPKPHPDPDITACNHADHIALTLVLGDISGNPVSYAIPVQWPRRGDKKVLETTMNLEVLVPQ